MKYRSPVLCLVLLTLCRCGLAAEPRRATANDDELFWSLRRVRSVIPPVVNKPACVQSPVDSFVLAKLETLGLQPAPAADKRTLIRRATFDLIGLPPTPSEIAEFLADDSPDAFARVVDRLLASPQYGERWGRHWLDVVRYADARDLIQLPAESDFREAWRYRDWVVSAFNRDLPYDEFIRHQIAGDLLQPTDPARIDADALVATGMLAIADFVPGDVDKQQMIADYVNDQIDVVGRAFLGLTLACARCHDHKFDPITTEDYYALAGIFFSTRLVPGPIKGNTPLVRVPLMARTEIAALEANLARNKSRLAAVTEELATYTDREYRALMERRIVSDSAQYLTAAWQYAHSADGPARPDLAEFARNRGLESGPLSRWLRYLEESRPHPAFTSLRTCATPEEAKERISELATHLSQVPNIRRADAAAIAMSKLAEREILRLRSDDRRLAMNESQQVTSWPNRGHANANVVPVKDVLTPVMTTATVNHVSHNVLRFQGNELLQAPISVPSTGSLLIVYRPDPKSGPGQRLIGWEDASVGQHGLGIMIDGSGGVHIILRRSGASGDIVLPAPAADVNKASFQVLLITWGPAGVTVSHNGQVAPTNKGIEAISSDPAITSLRIGGPGSGASPRFQGDLAELRVFNIPLEEADRLRLEAELTARWNGPVDSQPPVDSTSDLYDELVSVNGPFQLEPGEQGNALMEESRQRLASLRMEQDALKTQVAPLNIPQAVVVQEGGPPGTPHEGFRDAAVYVRGNHLQLGKIVPRGVPKSLAGEHPLIIATGSGRRELADWLTQPTNPLTSRVMVNRIWQHHFGAGLVRSSANFGAMGESPSHPELLDSLTTFFVTSGWSVKKLHRQIMLSSTYQQSSQASDLPQGLAKDPENQFLWRANRRRLESETLRDSLLSVAQRLDPTPGGPGFQETATPRRSLYLMSVRTGTKAEFGSLFDAPDCSGIVERRAESIVAPQALFLMNDPFVLNLANGLAERVISERPESDNRERIRRLYEIVFGRSPIAAEVEIGLSLLGVSAVENDPAKRPASSPVTPEWMRYCHLILSTNEFLYVD